MSITASSMRALFFGLGSVAGGWLFGLAIGAPFWLAAALLLVGALIALVAGQRLPATAE